MPPLPVHPIDSLMTKNPLYDKVQGVVVSILDLSCSRPCLLPQPHMISCCPHHTHDSSVLLCFISPPCSECDSLSPFPNQTFLSLVHSSYPSRQLRGHLIREGFCSVVSPGPSTSPQPSKTTKQDRLLLDAFSALAQSEGNCFSTLSLLSFQPKKSRTTCVFHLYTAALKTMAGT